ncbi:MAG: ROK family protein [Candidatus Omnitrophica bacterium]|nr:ROK family protein [Candidatus Omnitrophota bacterium]
MKKYIIGVDIGGTKIAAGIVHRSGKLREKHVVPTLAGKGFDVSMGQVELAIKELLKASKVSMKDIEGIGVCAPGPLDPDKGIVHNPPNLPGWREVPLVEKIRKKFRKKTKLENDANSAGMAEVIWGAAKGFKHVFYVTVSTGIGTGIIIDGKIYHGKNGMAGEGGHVTINYTDRSAVCNCGNIGCIESLASGPSTVKRLVGKLRKNPRLKTSVVDIAGGELDNITMVDIGEAAREGDKVALEAVKQQGKLLGIWLGSMISVLDPEIIVIGGGVSLLGGMLFREIRSTIPARTINIFSKKTQVVQAKLKRDVGIYGAASILLV